MARLKKRKVCLYHKDCLDGTAAAWAVLNKYPDIQCIPVEYHAPIPEGLDDCDVIMVDFCYKLPAMKRLLDTVNSLIVIDHHEPTASVINDLKRYSSWIDKKLEIVFDLNFSGCQLTWRYFNPDRPLPSPIQHVGDADLWKFKLPNTKDIVYGLSGLPQDPHVWTDTLSIYFNKRAFSDVRFNRHFEQHGKSIRGYLTEQYKRVIKQTKRMICMNNMIVPMVNCPRSMASEVLEILYQDYPFAVSYYDTQDKRIFSLRSSNTNANSVRVNDIAVVFGGNGHPHAAGFTVPRDHRMAKM